ncbi:MAG TPA: hypothetical protein VFB60_06915 [Ktedonobacteraceae bacterium]|nr:hypothetical protein [Ktedonobacteraceae bacterium]
MAGRRVEPKATSILESGGPPEAPSSCRTFAPEGLGEQAMPPGPTLEAAGTLGVRKRPAGVIATMQYQVAFGTQCFPRQRQGRHRLPARRSALSPLRQLPGSAKRFLDGGLGGVRMWGVRLYAPSDSVGPPASPRRADDVAAASGARQVYRAY